MNTRKRIMWMVECAMLSALAIVLYYFPKFPLPIFPEILKIQFSMLPTLIGGFALGPIGGILICVIKFLFKIIATNSAGIGEFVDLGIGLAVSITTSLMYSKFHTKKGALIALSGGIIVWVIMGAVLNGIVAIPLYMKLYGLDAEGVAKFLSIVPGINKDNYMFNYIVYACIPFNIIIASTVSVITFFVYKRVSWLFDRMDGEPKKSKVEDEEKDDSEA